VVRAGLVQRTLVVVVAVALVLGLRSELELLEGELELGLVRRRLLIVAFSFVVCVGWF